MLVWLEQVLGVESVAFFHHTLIIFIFLRYLFLHIVLFVYAKQKNESWNRLKLYLFFHGQYYWYIIYIALKYLICKFHLKSIAFLFLMYWHLLCQYWRLLETVLNEMLVMVWIILKMFIGCLICTNIFAQILTFLSLN